MRGSFLTCVFPCATPPPLLPPPAYLLPPPSEEPDGNFINLKGEREKQIRQLERESLCGINGHRKERCGI
jgi:hypothetical protein